MVFVKAKGSEVQQPSLLLCFATFNLFFPTSLTHSSHPLLLHSLPLSSCSPGFAHSPSFIFLSSMCLSNSSIPLVISTHSCSHTKFRWKEAKKCGGRGRKKQFLFCHWTCKCVGAYRMDEVWEKLGRGWFSPWSWQILFIASHVNLKTGLPST